MIREGYNSIQRNWTALVQYLAILLPVHIAIVVAGQFVINHARTMDPALISLFHFGKDILAAFGYALAQSVVFARIGADVDRPFWKYDGPRDAIRRFFAFWLILDLVFIAIRNLMVSVGAEAGGSTEAMAVLTWVLLRSFVVPFGACVMFYGAVKRPQLEEAVDTMASQMPRLLSVLLMSCGVYFFLHLIVQAGQIPEFAFPLLTVIEGYVDCVVFACVWIICMYHRDEEPEDHDFDF